MSNSSFPNFCTYLIRCYDLQWYTFCRSVIKCIYSWVLHMQFSWACGHLCEHLHVCFHVFKYHHVFSPRRVPHGMWEYCWSERRYGFFTIASTDVGVNNFLFDFYLIFLWSLKVDAIHPDSLPLIMTNLSWNYIAEEGKGMGKRS